jgi:hypothetical protein
MDSDRALLAKVAKTRDFFGSILCRDTLDDWTLAKDLGEFLIRIEPDGIIGHALLVRAFRHLGNSERALNELNICRLRAAAGDLIPSEAEVLLPVLADEERLLSGDAARPQPK